jgi:hypothetical protein
MSKRVKNPGSEGKALVSPHRELMVFAIHRFLWSIAEDPASCGGVVEYWWSNGVME